MMAGITTAKEGDSLLQATTQYSDPPMEDTHTDEGKYPNCSGSLGTTVALQAQHHSAGLCQALCPLSTDSATLVWRLRS